MPSSPPPPPPKRYDLVEGFNALALSGSPGQNQRKGSGDYNIGYGTSANNAFTNLHTNGFVGGFSPERVALNASLDASRAQRNDYGLNNNNGPFRVPDAPVLMPVPQVPQSRTMQYALQGPSRQGATPPKPPPKPPAPSTPPRPSTLAPGPVFDRPPPPRPTSDSALSPPNVKSPKARKASSVSPGKALDPVPSTPPRNKRANSTPPSPTSSTPGKDSVRCAAITKVGNPCKRTVKVGAALSALDPDSDVERFCHQHQQDLMQPSGYYSRKTGQWIDFGDWIPDYLHPDTQAVLRAVMEKPKSNSDVDGYIYTFEIRDKNTPDVVHLKVGRAVNLTKRLDQWQKQCGSKEQVVRGWWPGTVEDGDDDDVSLLKGRIKAGEKGPLCHRLERLIHLELADLVVNTPYLDPKWPNVKHSGLNVSSKNTVATVLAKKNHPCADCGTIHKEIFSFKRVKKGRYEGKEWDSLVKPVIEKWGAFVEHCV